MFVTHDFDEALRLADRIAIMKDGIIEQLDTPANIVLSPATEYVRKFTQEVPREKVLKIEDVMESTSDNNLSDLQVSKDAIIETVAEKILSQEKPVAVIDSNSNPDGVDFPIPGNDDARRSIDLYCSLIKETIENAKKEIPISEEIGSKKVKKLNLKTKQ